MSRYKRVADMTPEEHAHHLEQCRRRNNAYRERHPEKVREKERRASRKRRAKDIEGYRAYQRAYYSAHRERFAELRAMAALCLYDNPQPPRMWTRPLTTDTATIHWFLSAEYHEARRLERIEEIKRNKLYEFA